MNQMKIFGNWQSEFVTDSNIVDLLANMNANANSKIDDRQFNRDSFSPLFLHRPEKKSLAAKFIITRNQAKRLTVESSPFTEVSTKC